MKIGVFGQQGSGKTLISIIMSRFLANLDKSVTIYTNMNVTGDNFIVINDLGDIPFDRSPKILIVDEALFSIDSRSSSSKHNQIWTRAIAFFRKSNFIAVFFATHRPNMLDVRIREQLDYVLMARRSPDRFEYMLLDMTSYEKKLFFMPKTQQLYNYANYDTYDFPHPIDITKIKDTDLFSIRK